MSNVFAQAEALAFGKTAEQVKAEGTPDWLVPHRTFEGNRPTNVDPGRAAHARDARARSSRSTSTASSPRETIWHINSFDQWGVELGKVLAKRIIPELKSRDEPKLAHDSSTNALDPSLPKAAGLRVEPSTEAAADRPPDIRTPAGPRGARLSRLICVEAQEPGRSTRYVGPR